MSQHEAFKALSRQSKVTSLAISHDGKRIAVGDEAGKIYLLYNVMPDQSSKQAKLVIQSLPQWHAYAVSCHKFTTDGFLLSAGKESVLV